MRICETFGKDFDWWNELSYKEKLRYQYYMDLKSRKEQHEIEKAKKERGSNKYGM
jgi:hypothetical protein